jgi:hypothetical protein
LETVQTGCERLYVGPEQATYGEVANLSFESGAMLLNDEVVMMSLPSDINEVDKFYLSVSESRDVYVSAGYELETSEQ